jgi:ABC-type uncharacterized transport system substrate-binding protein
MAGVSLMMLPAAGLWSHPHVFIYSAVEIVFDENGLSGFDIRWQFDEMFSSMIFLDYDKNGNRQFESSEMALVQKEAFVNLRKFNYFTHIKINGEPFKVQFVTDFSARINKDNLIYRFFVPCHVQAIENIKTVKVAIYDQTFYSSVFLIQNPVAYKNGSSFDVDHTIEKNKDDAYYFGQIYPEEITLNFRRKNG